MDKAQVSRIMRVSDQAKAKSLERVLRYEAECRTIDRIMVSAMDIIVNG